jgi:hypothetical protein
MAIVFDASSQRIVLDSASVSASELWSRWVDWAALSDNAKYPPAFRQVGGDDLGSGLFIPPYLFLLNGWRVRPMEANHTLVITGNLFVEGGGVPVVATLGSFNVSAQYTVPVQAQGIATSGSSGPTAAEIAAEVLLQAQSAPIWANVQKMNDADVIGTGGIGDAWRGRRCSTLTPSSRLHSCRFPGLAWQYWPARPLPPAAYPSASASARSKPPPSSGTATKTKPCC